MRVLVACEESQAVCMAFRARGHEAYSCDLQDCSGGHPEWHIKGDALELLKMKWDLLIAHPPCTYITSAGSRWILNAQHQVISTEREQKMRDAVKFFMSFLNADVKRIAVENPAPLHIAGLPPYSQIIQPYMFGDPWKKRTCLWLRGLPPLEATNQIEPKACWIDNGRAKGGSNRTKLFTEGWKGKHNARERSKTFPGIAQAMAEQWGREE
jgi:hypothetical protein